jgi:hypothetical protein
VRAFIVFSGAGPILVLTSYTCLTDPRALDRFRHQGISKFLAYEVAVDRVREQYGVPFEVMATKLDQVEDVRVLDFNGHNIFANFSLTELGEPVRHGD